MGENRVGKVMKESNIGSNSKHIVNTPKDYQECSREVYDLLDAFNNLPTAEEQEEVLDVIYDALYDRSYIEVLSERVVMSKTREIAHLNQLISTYEKKIEDQRVTINNITNEQQGNKRKILRRKIKGLLIIINNIKHYLGDKWQTVFPGGVEHVDEFLYMVDTQNVLGTDTWSGYEKKYSTNLESEYSEEDCGAGNEQELF